MTIGWYFIALIHITTLNLKHFILYMYKRYFHLDFNPYWPHIIEENAYENTNTAGKIRVCTSREMSPSHISLEVTVWDLWLKAGNKKAVKPLKQFPRAWQPSSFILMWARPHQVLFAATWHKLCCHMTSQAHREREEGCQRPIRKWWQEMARKGHLERV